MKTLDIQTRIQVKNVLFLTDFSLAAAEAIPWSRSLPDLATIRLSQRFVPAAKSACAG